MQRLMRAAIGTNNIDNCSRVCHSPTSFALRKAFGLSGATGSFADIDHTDATILIGANPTEGHPVVGARIKQATLRGMKLVTIDPRRIELADYGVLHLSPRPGSNAAVMLGIAHVDPPRRAHRRRLHRRAAPRATTRCSSCSPQYTPEAVEEISGVPAADLERAAHIYGEANNACFSWGLGVTEHKYGSEVVQLICNLALMTGNVGRAGAALLPLRGQNNVQGSSDMGALPDTLHRRTARSATRRSRGRSRRRGASTIPREKGLHDPADVRRGGRRRPQGDVHLRRGRRADRPEHRARRGRAREPRVPGLPGHLRDRDDQVRRRDPARLVLPREGGHVHQRRAARSSSSRPRSSRPAARRPTSRSSRRSRARSATTWAARRSRGRDGRDRRADAATSPA